MSYVEHIEIELTHLHNNLDSDVETILISEIAAMNAYREVLAKMDEDTEKWKLEYLLHDHEDAVTYWKSQMHFHPSLFEDITSIWAKSLRPFLSKTGLNNTAVAIKGLREGEMYEKKMYENFLKKNTISASQKSYIKTVLLPAHENHLKRLEGMNLHTMALAR